MQRLAWTYLQALGFDPATPDLHGGAQGSSFGEAVGGGKMLEGEQAAEEAAVQKSYQASHFNLGLPLSPEFGALALAAEPKEALRQLKQVAGSQGWTAVALGD